MYVVVEAHAQEVSRLQLCGGKVANVLQCAVPVSLYLGFQPAKRKDSREIRRNRRYARLPEWDRGLLG